MHENVTIQAESVTLTHIGLLHSVLPFSEITSSCCFSSCLHFTLQRNKEDIYLESGRAKLTGQYSKEAAWTERQIGRGYEKRPERKRQRWRKKKRKEGTRRRERRSE